MNINQTYLEALAFGIIHLLIACASCSHLLNVQFYMI